NSKLLKMEFSTALIKQLIDKKTLKNQGISSILVIMLFAMPLVMFGAAADKIPFLKDYKYYLLSGGFVIPLLVILLYDLKNKIQVLKIKTFKNKNRELTTAEKHQPWEKIGNLLLNEITIQIKSDDQLKIYPLKEVTNLDIRNEAEIPTSGGSRGILDSRVYQNNVTWNPISKGYTNYISFSFKTSPHKLEKIRYNFLINTNHEVELLKELFKIWEQNGISFKK
ncbi:MAG TPA: hypothetical protein VEC36_05405, partial [Patescibacteria group bacterium]|nr:hypothetical protein [Patescibacteria group bacterium]